MEWIDMHCDTLSETGKQKKELKSNDLCVDLERLRRAGACAQFFACYVNAAEYGLKTKKIPERTVWDMAYRDVVSSMAIYKMVVSESPILNDLMDKLGHAVLSYYTELHPDTIDERVASFITDKTNNQSSPHAEG